MFLCRLDQPGAPVLSPSDSLGGLYLVSPVTVLALACRIPLACSIKAGSAPAANYNSALSELSPQPNHSSSKKNPGLTHPAPYTGLGEEVTVSLKDLSLRRACSLRTSGVDKGDNLAACDPLSLVTLLDKKHGSVVPLAWSSEMESWSPEDDRFSFLRSAPHSFSLCHREGPNRVEIFDITSIPSHRSSISETTCLCDIFGDDCESPALSSSPPSGSIAKREEDEFTLADDTPNDSPGSYHTASCSEQLSDSSETYEDSKEALTPVPSPPTALSEERGASLLVKSCNKDGEMTTAALANCDAEEEHQSLKPWFISETVMITSSGNQKKETNISNKDAQEHPEPLNGPQKPEFSVISGESPREGGSGTFRDRKEREGAEEEQNGEEQGGDQGEGIQEKASYGEQQVELSFSARNRKAP
ncbi:hypothetical protein JZ751_007080, partial [Albula glossodonta]